MFSVDWCADLWITRRKRIAHDRHSKNRTLVAQLHSYTIYTKSACRADLSASWLPSCRSWSLSFCASITSTFRGVWPTKMGLDSLTQKSHTLIVICEDQVIGWYELIEERGARRAIRLCFSSLFCRYCERRDLSIQKAKHPRFKQACENWKKSEDGSAFGSSIQ